MKIYRAIAHKPGKILPERLRLLGPEALIVMVAGLNVTVTTTS